MSLLSASHVRRIEDDLSSPPTTDPQRDAWPRRDADERPPLEIVVREGDLATSELVAGDLPGPWIRRPVPVDCSAIGLCVPLAGHSHLGSIVARSGRAQWFGVVDGVISFDSSPSSRLLDDACRRRLGLETAPPLIGTDWYWISRWLLDIRATVELLDPGLGLQLRLLDLITVAGLHPAVEPDDFAGLDRRGITRLVIERHRDHASVADWSCVRLDALADRHHLGHRLATSLDEGAFSRWISACSVPLSLLAEPLFIGCSPLGLELIGSVIADVVVRRGVGSS